MRWATGICAAFIILGLAYLAHGQAVLPPYADPNGIACAYNSSPPTATSGTVIWAQCDSSGHLITTGSGGSVILGTGSAHIGTVGLGYTSAQTPLSASATGTTAATTATLSGVTGKTTYICGWSIDADATTATVVNMTVTGLISGTETRRQGVGPAASGTISTWQTYLPCLPASATNTAVAVVSGAAGTGGNTAVNAWGYQE